MSLRLLLAGCLIVTAGIPSSASGQIRGFYPPVDSIYIGGSCSMPQMVWSVAEGSHFIDTIRMRADEWSRLWHVDSLPWRHEVDECYFLVADSANSFSYEISYRALYPPSTQTILVPFDTTFPCSDPRILITLCVARQGVAIDSMSILLLPQFGLEVRRRPGDELFAGGIHLSQNYPNPFNPRTNFQFSNSNLQFVSLKVFDMLGREVATLVNEEMKPGTYEVTFDASNLASGTYFYKLITTTGSIVRKLTLVR